MCRLICQRPSSLQISLSSSGPDLSEGLCCRVPREQTADCRVFGAFGGSAPEGELDIAAAGLLSGVPAR